MVASVARVVAALCVFAVLASAMPHRPHRSRDAEASLIQTSSEAHVSAGAQAMAQLQHMHHVELLRAPVPGALLADEPLADAAVTADPMFVEVASMQIEPLEFVGTRCVCAVWTNSQPVVGTNKGRTVIRGTCTASIGYESTEACNCWGLEVPCSSDKPTTKISTLSDFMPGACAAIRNETIKKDCDGPACPMFGYAETIASWKYEARNFTEGKEKCKLQTDRVACTNAKRCDCQVSGWSEWSPCDKKCGTGLSYRNRTVLLPASNGGSCPHLSETVKCMHSRCPRDCKVSAWGPWSECSSNCGSGYRYRTRQVTKTARNGGAECPALIDTIECVGTECTVNSTDCQFSEWSSWSTCSESCGAGTEVRSRTLISPKLAIGVPGCAWCTGCGALKQARPCNAVQCPRDCVVSEWSAWSKCSKSCGGGARTRTRRILVTSQNNGAQCPRLFESQDCNTQDCPQDCEVGAWSDWSVCGASCGAGEQTRTRPVLKYPLAGGKKCPALLERRNCDAGACSPQCKLSTWGPWSECSKSCGTGIKERRRYILEIIGNATEVDCGSLGEVAVCNTQVCPSDCVLSPWRPAEQDRSGSPFFPGGLIGTNTNPTNRMQDPAAAGGQAFSKCTAECGGGWMFRQRDVVREAKGAGRACSTRYEAVPCALLPCPVDCIVSEWGSWSNCSTPCGEGTQTRTRNILRHPAHGGKTCPELSQDRSCAGLPCPKEFCPSAFWSDWSKCSSQCGTGQRSRTKMFESQTSKLGPRNVCGPLSDLGTCNSAPCPQDCVLSDWGNWSQCSVSCGTGVQYRTRSVLRPNSNGGRPCAADLLETRACESNPCPADCQVGAWSSWSECSSHCGDGVQYRLREVISPPLNGGKKCPRLMDARNCRNGACAPTCQYGQWSPWSNCTHTCGSSGIARRSRPLFAGAKNECGDLIQELPCNVGPCPTNCEVSDWTEWSPCSDACDGLSYRRRLIKTPATFGGLPCPSLTETKSCSTPKCNTLAYKLSNPEGCQYRQRTPWGPCESDCGENPLKGTRRRFVLATPESRNLGCADKPEEEPCEIPDPTGELRANLRQQIADQLPKGGVMTQADGQKVQVNVHLNVLIKHQGKEGKVCPLTTTIEL